MNVSNKEMGIFLHKESLQQKVSLYVKWFHWILNEFTGCSERGPLKKQWIP
jgi:hypothetical protein